MAGVLCKAAGKADLKQNSAFLSLLAYLFAVGRQNWAGTA